ncbi:hypothetical protein [Corynebacterium bouchesdurhonense]|uniref:hypothetical protein n=1 Tax=Corynebacterium bouchesdurhonense TaxID=1720192 RepID=UPI00082B0563|nr:hypothetical protein [Corynebacterium bouchesdurhonense]
MVQQSSVPEPGLLLDDEWLDTLEGPPERRTARQMVHDTFARPGRFIRRAGAFASTTPGQIVAMMLVLTVALIAAGFSMSQSMASRQRALDTLVSTTEPMANSAHQLYSSLSQADTVATTGFVQPGLLNEQQLRLYLESVDKAAVTAADIHSGAPAAGAAVRGQITGAVTEILRSLPVYTALMERAKVNQRVGNPVGVAYMTEASAVMREDMLLSAEQLSELTQREVADEVARLSSPQWVPLSGLVAALLFLVLAQWWLWRVFRRRLNRGFLAATLAVVVAIGWVGVASFESWRSGVVGFERAAEPWRQLSSARIEAQETRTDETLALLSRQSISRSSESFAETSAHVTDALAAIEGLGGPGEDITAARAALRSWSESHEAFALSLADGQFERASELLTASPGAASAFADLDGALDRLITFSRQNTRAYIDASLDATRRVAAAVALLTLAAVACIWIGIRHRLGEYF